MYAGSASLTSEGEQPQPHIGVVFLWVTGEGLLSYILSTSCLVIGVVVENYWPKITNSTISWGEMCQRLPHTYL